MITEIKWNNHPVLGNLVLKLTKSDGTPYKTIVIAGENGTGKTTILETLSDFLNLNSIEVFEYIKYEINGEIYKIVPNSINPQFGFHKRTKESDGSEITITSSKHTDRASIDADELDIRHYGCAYSKARSGFTTKPVKSTTTQQLDDDKYAEDKNEDFTLIKQLLVDIKTQDNSLLAKKFEKREITTPEEYAEISKMKRFKTAFDNFFENMSFDGVDDESPDEKKIVFMKQGNQISIDQLSTGEKQIAFRGTYLLKNSNNLNGGVVLVDEPELSMHPKWQAKIFDFYRGLFTANGSQTAQMFFATHSENVIRSAVKDSEVLIIILSETNGVITANKINEIVLPSLTAAEINYLAFGVKSVDYHIALYGDLQTQTGNAKIEDADLYIAAQSEYDASIHGRADSYRRNHYQTLPTYIRNAIDHPDSGRRYTDEQMEASIKLLRDICKRLRTSP